MLDSNQDILFRCVYYSLMIENQKSIDGARLNALWWKNYLNTKCFVLGVNVKTIYSNKLQKNVPSSRRQILKSDI